MRRRNLGLTGSGVLSVVERVLVQYPTTATERFLLMTAIVFLPLQTDLPTVTGLSSSYLMFGLLAVYVLLNRLRALNRTWLHPAFLAAYALLVLAVSIEFLHPHASFYEIIRIGEMFAAAIFVASLCRDRDALRAGIYGYLLAGMWMSVFLLLTLYGGLSKATAIGFTQASQVRAQIIAGQPSQANPNDMAFVAAQGAVVALALALTARSSRRCNLFLGVVLICSTATFLPMSRGGIAILVASCAAVMSAYGILRAKAVMMVAAIVVAILMLVPDVVFFRLAFPIQVPGATMESRVRIYTVLLEHLPEYVMTGVGAGNFLESWGFASGFARYYPRSVGVVGAHNTFFEVWIYWGLAAFLALIAVVYQGYRCLPKRSAGDVLALCLYGIAVSSLLLLLVSHITSTTTKYFALALGLLVGARLWIWPEGIIIALRAKR